MSRSVLLVVAASVLLSSSLAAQMPDAVQAALLHKGKDAMVHAAPLQPGYLITFTVPSSGVMKPLLKALPPPMVDSETLLAAKHAGIRRPRQTIADLIAGVAVDDERLYVVTAKRVFQAASTKSSTGGQARASHAAASAGGAAEVQLIGHQFRLHAFSLKDGAALMGDGYELPLVSEDPKATAPPDTTKVKETLGRGPIELVPGGLKCRGTTVIFSGDGVKSLEVKGKQFTPPPGFFQHDPDGPVR